MPVNKVKSGKHLKKHMFICRKKHRKKVQQTVVNNLNVWQNSNILEQLFNKLGMHSRRNQKD
jgi:hypothetical protein